MPYVIKTYLFRDDNTLDLRLTIKTKDFNDVIEMLSRVSFDYYDRVLVLPDDFTNDKQEN